MLTDAASKIGPVLAKLTTNHAASRAAIDRSAAAIVQCNTDAFLQRAKYENLLRDDKLCKAKLHALADELAPCWIWKAFRERVRSACDGLESVREGCTLWKRHIEILRMKCSRTKITAAAKKKACNTTHHDLNLAACGLKHLCESCYNDAVAEYRRLVAATEPKVADWKRQWQILKHMSCIADAHDVFGRAIQDKLHECSAAGDYPTDHLNIIYPEVPPNEGYCEGIPRDGTDTRLHGDCTAGNATSLGPPDASLAPENGMGIERESGI